MENKKNSVKENQSKRAADQKNAAEIERSSVVESKISTVESTPEEEKSTKNSFREETKEGNGILKETASESYFRGVNDTKKVDNSDREREEDTMAKIIVVDQLDKSHLRDELLSNGSKRKIKNSGKIDDAAMTGRRRHQRPFHDIIGKREQRREELEKMEGNLRQRLDMLECSVPAVMVWNIWRMSQGAPVCRMKRILEKQFKDTKELACRSTPSRHYDCRVRQVEAERKLALRKVEEARTLWSEKLARLEERKNKLEEARKIQEEQKNAIERLNEEVKALRESLEKPEMNDELCDEHDECGDTRCKRRRLGKVSSVTSVNSGDIQCLEKLQRLAEEEMIMKRDIIELEQREEAYMRTLQQADELWSKMEGDTVSVTSALQEQLDMKTAANQQLAERVCELEDALEKCRTRLAACTAELEKFTSVERVAATIGRDDDIAEVTDKEVTVRAKVLHRPIGRVDDVATVEDKEVLARVEVADKKTWAKAEDADAGMLARIDSIDADAEVAFVGDDKYVSVKPDLVDLAVDRPVDLAQIEDAESAVQLEDLARKQQRFKEVREYLAKLGSLEELYKDDGEPCAPDFVCNDVVSSPIGITDEELSMLGVEPAAPKKLDEKLITSEDEQNRQFREKLTSDVVDDVKVKEKEAKEIPGIEIEKKVIRKAEETIIEVEDAPVKETVTIREKTSDDRPVTMLDGVRLEIKGALEIKKIETDQGIVIQRNTILSWVDAIDAIRTKAAVRNP